METILNILKKDCNPIQCQAPDQPKTPTKHSLVTDENRINTLCMGTFFNWRIAVCREYLDRFKFKGIIVTNSKDSLIRKIHEIKYNLTSLNSTGNNKYHVYADIILEDLTILKNINITFESMYQNNASVILALNAYDLIIYKDIDQRDMAKYNWEHYSNNYDKHDRNIDAFSIGTDMDSIYLPTHYGYWKDDTFGVHSNQTNQHSKPIIFKHMNEESWSQIEIQIESGEFNLMEKVSSLEKLEQNPLQICHGNDRILIVRTSVKNINYGKKDVSHGDIVTPCKCGSHSPLFAAATCCKWIKNERYYNKFEHPTVNLCIDYNDYDMKTEFQTCPDVFQDVDMHSEELQYISEMDIFSRIQSKSEDDDAITVAIIYPNSERKRGRCVVLPQNNVKFIEGSKTKYSTKCILEQHSRYNKNIIKEISNLNTVYSTVIRLKDTQKTLHVENLLIPEIMLPDHYIDDTKCCACLENDREVAFVPCGHRCICRQCAKFFEKNDKCPICRAKSTARITIFL